MKENLLLVKDFLKLKNKIYKNTNAISKNVSIDKLDDIVDEYNSTYYRAVKMKLII